MSGFLNIDKPAGKSSAHIVNIVKRVTGSVCGHLGTLDPFATGVLPVGIGNATRLFDYFLTKQKTYRARFRFGVTTDTLDPEGKIAAEGFVPDEEALRAALPSLTGEISQVPPAYSAKSVDGKRSYLRARMGEPVALACKQVTVYAFDLVGQTAKDEYEFQIVCGAGTYIRALARDLAAAVGTVGYCSMLRRTASGVFTESTAVPPDALTPETWQNYLIPTDSVLPLPVLDCSDVRLYNGLSVPTDAADGLYKLYDEGKFYGLARAADGLLKTEKKLC